MKDASREDSGNIYFGDPTFGTLEQMDAFMYAENNFYDNNLSATRLRQRDGERQHDGRQPGRASTATTARQHSKLTVNFDGRISTGAIDAPGPARTPGSGAAWNVVCWREVPVL